MCAEGPWRRDVAPGQFDTGRYDALGVTVGRPGREVPVVGPIFACHKSVEGTEEACAGWLAVTGYNHLGIRLMVAAQGRQEGP